MIIFFPYSKNVLRILKHAIDSAATSFFYIIHLLRNPALNNFSFAGQTNDGTSYSSLKSLACNNLSNINLHQLSDYELSLFAHHHPFASQICTVINSCRGVSGYYLCFYFALTHSFFFRPRVNMRFAKIVFNQCLAILNCYEHIRTHSIIVK